MTFWVPTLLVLVDHLTCTHWFSLLPPQIQQLVRVNQVLKKEKKARKETTLLLFADCELQVKKEVFFFFSLTTAEQANSCKL